MADIDLDGLERLATAASVWGGWAIWPDLKEGGFVHVGNTDGVIPAGGIATREHADPNPIAKAYTPEIGEFIAAADPQTVLALIERVKLAEAVIAEAAEWAQWMTDKRAILFNGEAARYPQMQELLRILATYQNGAGHDD